jgi:pilus assembly protein FimV
MVAPTPAPAAVTAPPAAASASVAASTPPSTADTSQSAPPAAAESPKKVETPAAIPPEPDFLDDPDNQMVLAGIAVLLVVAAGYVVFRRRKMPMPDFGSKAKGPAAGKAAPAPAPPKKPLLGKAPPAPPPLPLPRKTAPGKLGDTTSLPDAKLPAAAPRAPDQTQNLGRTAVVEPLLAQTALDDTAKLQTAQFKQAETALAASNLDLPPKPKNTPAGGDNVDFDLTSQFEAQTMSINLDANDPLSEADFHLAYGLYDEAASLLKQALVKEPKRQELRMKLVETYFAGGKPMEFQETAEAMQGKVSGADWQKIAIMGRQLCPDSAMFKSDGSAPAPDIDLSLGDSIGPAPAQVLGTTSSKPTAPQERVIDFDLDAELSKSMPPAPMHAPAKPAKPAAASDKKDDFDLSQFDFSGDAPASSGGGGSIEFNLDELDLSKPGTGGGGGLSSGDEIGTKLDLARVYADMGDNEAAGGLLKEVLATGNATQKGEAEALMKRLSA